MVIFNSYVSHYQRVNVSWIFNTHSISKQWAGMISPSFRRICAVISGFPCPKLKTWNETQVQTTIGSHLVGSVVLLNLQTVKDWNKYTNHLLRTTRWYYEWSWSTMLPCSHLSPGELQSSQRAWFHVGFHVAGLAVRFASRNAANSPRARPLNGRSPATVKIFKE